MNWRQHPVFSSVLGLCGLLVVAACAGIYERRAEERDSAARLAKKRAELEAIATLEPAPSREVAATIEADLARARRALESMQAELKGHGPIAEQMRQAKVPAARTDAYFDLAAFIERARELARKNEVAIRPEAARFGFAAYAGEAPDFEHLEPVFRQRQVMEYLVESLLEARPRTLLAVKRERPLNKKEREERLAAALAAASATPDAAAEAAPEVSVPDETSPDLFAFDPRTSARAPGFLDATAFRIGFIGQTATLRNFLNRLASFELPVLVREVEVEPVSAEEAARDAVADDTPATEAPSSPAASVVLSVEAPSRVRAAGVPARLPPGVAATATPLVVRPYSKFTVMIEYVELVPPAAPAAESAPANE